MPSSKAVTCDIALPPSSRSMNGTFSISSHRGNERRRSSSEKRHATSPDCRPRMPAVRPHWLRSWQGKPALTSSTSGRRNVRAATSCRMSSRIGTPGNRLASTRLASGRNSQKNSVLKPALDSPSSMPPIPANSAAAVARGAGAVSRSASLGTALRSHRPRATVRLVPAGRMRRVCRRVSGMSVQAGPPHEWYPVCPTFSS